MKFKIIALLILMFGCGFASRAWAANPSLVVTNSTTPLGTPYYRHLAADYNVDLRELVKFERKGFGRSEIVSIVILSQMTGKPMKEYGNRRIKNKTPLKTFAEEANLNYRDLMSVSREIKLEIEARGETNLPPPVYPKPSPSPDVKKRPEPLEERNEDEIDNKSP